MVKGPVFIGGCVRSGTTALWNALIKHPNLGPAEGMSQDKELRFLAEFFEGRSERETGRRQHGLDVEYEREGAMFIHEFLKRHCGSPTGRYVTAFVDNILHVEKMRRLVPEARMLLLIRHPQENVWSLLNAFFSSYIRRSRNADRITVREIARATDIWKTRAHVVLRAMAGEFGPNVRVVRQERMIREPEAVARSVLEFVDEPFEQAVADALSFGIINTSFPPGREPNEKSFLETIPVMNAAAREGFFAQNRERMTRAPNLCAVVGSLAAEEMRLLGYENLEIAAQRPAGERTDAEQAGAEARVERAAELAEIAILDRNGRPRDSFMPMEEATLRVVVRANQAVKNPSVSFLVRDVDGMGLFGTTTFDEGVKLRDLGVGEQVAVRFAFPMALRLGRYSVCVACNSVSIPGYADNVLHHQIDDVAFFSVAYSQERPIHYKFNLATAISVEALAVVPADVARG
jgi:hypothetical protein